MQALFALAVGLAACGQERVSDPFTPYSRESGDTVAVLRAVASVIAEMNARWDTARAAPDFPNNCRTRALRCWNIQTTDWYVSTGDHVTAMLADLLGVRATTRSPAAAPPACPWPSRTADAGHRTVVRIRFTGTDVGEVALSRACDNPPGYTHDFYGAWEAFEVRRVNGAWKATLTSVGVT